MSARADDEEERMEWQMDIDEDPSDVKGKEKKPRVTRNTMMLAKLSEELGRPVTGKEKNDAEALLELLDMDSVETLNEFLASRRWKRHFDMHKATVLIPGREAARSRGEKYGRGPDLSKVQAALIAGELHGQGQFSDKDPDKRDWTPLQHAAMFLWDARRDQRFLGGFAFMKNYSDAIIDYCIWQILGREIARSNPSRTRKIKEPVTTPEASTKLLAEPVAEAASSSPLSITNVLPVTNFQAPLVPQELRDVLPGLLAAIAKNEPPRSEIGWSLHPNHLLEKRKRVPDPISNTATTRPLNQAADPGVQASSGSEGRGAPVLNPTGNDDLGIREIDGGAHVMGSGGDPGDDDSDHDSSDGGRRDRDHRSKSREQSPPSPEVIPLDLYQAMVNERQNDHKISLDDRWGKYKVITIVLEHYQNADVITELVNHIGSVHGQDAFLWLEQVGLDTLRNPRNTSVLTEAHIQSYRKLEKLLTNPLFERMDLAGACVRLHVTNPAYPRIAGLVFGVYLRAWQVTGIDALVTMYNQGLRGALLADGMGTGKSLLMHGFMIHWGNLRRERRARGDRVGKSKPHMIICPPSLVRQHIGEIIEKTNSLRIALYYRDYRVGEEYGPRVQKIDTPLTKGHAIFNGDEDNDRLVIITTRQTLTIRHGTTALTDWRVEHGWTRERAEAGCFEPDPTWDRDISGEVEVCAVDECHEIKSKASKAASTIRLLGAVFYLLASGTPISNRVDDCGGYSHLIEPANADDLWSAQRLTAWNVTADVNPYELPLGHPAAILRTTERAANKFIFSHTVNDTVKGIRLEKLWEVCLISRRYDSIVPGTNDMKIAQYIPDVARKTMTLSFTDDERRVYEDYASVPLKKLIRPMDDNSGRVMWNMKYFRRLLMLSTWFGFHHIGHLVQHDSLGKWRLEANIIHTWLARVKVTEPVSPLPAKDNVTEILAVMCRASPKIRMILHVVADKIVLKQRKVIIWYLIPAHQLLVFGLLQLLRIPAIIGLVRHWLSFASMKMAFAGLNLHQSCYEMIFVDPPTSKQMRDQAEARARRLGQLFVVICTYLRVPGTFFDRIVANNLLKFLPTMIAELDHTIFDKNLEGNEDGESIAKLGDWARVNGVLMPAIDPRAAHVQRQHYLSTDEVLGLLLEDDAGEMMNMDSMDID